MEKRQHFRVSDFIRVEIHERDRQRFPRCEITESSRVRARHGDILDAVMEALRQARDEQCLTAREIRERLSEHLTERYAVVEHGDGQQHADPRRRPVSLSEGGICIELPPGSLQRVGHFLQLLLYLEDGGKPMRLSASRVGLEATDEATRLRLKFVNLDEVDRRRLFRYILQQQARKVRTAEAGLARQA
ncbi:PilZ domain-containing protein [Marinobacter lutaoensis]|nr:PilZ domain-containing protein [Marinobacter lutaoensis]